MAKDGVGGTVKCLAAQKRLQRAFENQIMTPYQLFLFPQAEISSIKFHFFTTSEYEWEAALLVNRFESSCTVAGTYKLHDIKLISGESVEVKEFSSSTKSRTEKVIEYSMEHKTVRTSELKGYITAKYDNHW